MSDTPQPASPTPDFGPDDRNTLLFARLVQQQAALAAMLLGHEPHPETGQTVTDLDSAQLFIDQLAMLETKTKGNLTEPEAKMLRQTIVNLRLAFVDAVQSTQKQEAKPAAAPEAPPASPATPASPAPAGEEEHRKKFSKTY